MRLTMLIMAVALASRLVQAPSITAGDPVVNGAQLRDGSWTMSWSILREGKEVSALTVDYELKRLGDRLLYVQTINSPRGKAVDSTLMKLATLEPISHRGYSVQRNLKLAFDGIHVTGSNEPAGAAAQPIHHMEKQKPFDSAALDIVIAALPLKSGYSARLPLYIYESGGSVWHDVSVVGESADAWEVEAKTPDTTVAFSIDKKTREVKAGRAQRGELDFRMTRKDSKGN